MVVQHKTSHFVLIRFKQLKENVKSFKENNTGIFRWKEWNIQTEGIIFVKRFAINTFRVDVLLFP